MQTEAESAIGVFKNAFGKCQSEADRGETAIGVLKNALCICKSEADKSESAIGVLLPKNRKRPILAERRCKNEK